MVQRKTSLLYFLLVVALIETGTGWADESFDHDRARQALEAKEVMSLRAILERVERDYPGQVVEVELERKRGRWIYEIRLVRTGGALVRLTIDARSGGVLSDKPGGLRGLDSRRTGED